MSPSNPHKNRFNMPHNALPMHPYLPHLPSATAYSIGWDVGAWHCKKGKSTSCDALAILTPQGELVGEITLGNITPILLETATTENLISRLFAWCQAPLPPEPVTVILGIDAALTLPPALLALLKGKPTTDSQPFANSRTNPYLYRPTEHYLFEHRRNRTGLLSPIQDQIGSQATKAMHLLARFAPTVATAGLWQSHNGNLVALEVYPAACKNTTFAIETIQRYPQRGEPHSDGYDALMCALVARTLLVAPQQLQPPPVGSPPAEGWIWIPKEALNLKHEG
jgi:hypothetical protein